MLIYFHYYPSLRLGSLGADNEKKREALKKLNVIFKTSI